MQMLRGLEQAAQSGSGLRELRRTAAAGELPQPSCAGWRDSIDPIVAQRPQWLTPAVNDIAQQIMVRINNAGAANAMNLCVTALLASRQRSLTRAAAGAAGMLSRTAAQCALFRRCDRAGHDAGSAAGTRAEHEQVRDGKDNIGDIIILPREQAVLMTYYRNNVHHMLVMPSLIAAIVQQHQAISADELLRQVTVIYPLLKSELFLRWDKAELPHLLRALTAELARQQLIVIEGDMMRLNAGRFRTLQLLAAGMRETLQRYAITFSILSANPAINRGSLEKRAARWRSACQYCTASTRRNFSIRRCSPPRC